MKYNALFLIVMVYWSTVATTISVIVKMANEVGYDMPFDLAMELMTGQSLDYCFNTLMQELIGCYLKMHVKYFVNALDAYRKNCYLCHNSSCVRKLNRPCCVASNGPSEKVILNRTHQCLTFF